MKQSRTPRHPAPLPPPQESSATKTCAAEWSSILGELAAKVVLLPQSTVMFLWCLKGPPHHPYIPILPRLAVPCPLRHPSPAVCPYAPVTFDSLPRLLPVPLTYAMPSPIPRPHVVPLAFLHPSPAFPFQP